MDFSKVKAIVFDVDGVFTNSQLLVLENGDLLRSMNTRDGYMVRRAIQLGFHLAVITGGKSEGVNIRLRNLGVRDIIAGSHYKLDDLRSFCEQYDYRLDDILFLGDDYPDYHVLHSVGYPCCPCDADPAIISICGYVSPFKGGEGAVRDVLAKAILAQGKSLIDEHPEHVSPSN
jgi:3-deoxy-D-manno-octulosonate 8-phosphate phosphatase (KDO 8-P phosphatase)